MFRAGSTKNPLFLFAFKFVNTTCPSSSTSTSLLPFYDGIRLILSHVEKSANGRDAYDKINSFSKLFAEQLVFTSSVFPNTIFANEKTNIAIDFIFIL